MEIDVKDLAMFTIIQKLKHVVNHKFHKLDEDFDLQEFLGDPEISDEDFKKIENNVFSDWLKLSDKDLKQLQTKILVELDKWTPKNLPRFASTGKSSKSLKVISSEKI
jgi:hypothetical protein